MTQNPIALAIALAFATSITLYGCDSTANLTEQEHIQRAKDFEDKGDLKGSIVELKNAVQKNPNSPQARLILGQTYLKVGMGAEAEKELIQAQKLGVNRETINPHLGEALLLTGDYKRVLDEIQPGEQTTKPNLARIMQLRADAKLRLGHLQDACSLYKQSLEINSQNPPTYWGLAQCAVAERNMALARQHLDTALTIKDRQDKTWVVIGELEELNTDIEAAMAAYSTALELDPENLDALERRASANIDSGRIEAAQADLKRIQKLTPMSVTANYIQARLKFREGKNLEARDAVQAVLKTAPNYIPALELGGAIEYALGNLQTAESYLNKVVRAKPRSLYAISMLSATQLRLKRVDDAEKTLAPIDLEKVNDPSILVVAGEIAQAKREYSKAVSYFERAAELSPNNASIKSQLGLIRLAQGDSRAYADLQAAAKMDNSSTRADTVIILNQLRQGQFDAALSSIAALEKKLTKSPLPWHYRGAAYLGKKDNANARVSFEHALKLDPTFLPAAVDLARLDMLDKKPESAHKRIESILALDKNNAKAMLALADLAAAEKNEVAYENWLERAAKADPKAIQPIAALVPYHLSKKEHQKAVALARDFSNSNPDSLQAMNLLGETQLAAGDSSAAISTFSRMTQKAPQSPEAFLRLAAAQIAAKQSARARDSLKRAIQLKPDFLKAQDALIRLELADGRPEAALKIARQLQSQYPESPFGFTREGDILLAQKRYSEASKAYEQAFAKVPNTASVIRLHRALHMTGEKKIADLRLADWIRQHPNDLDARGYAAEVYMVFKRNREAIAQYEALLRIQPDNVIALNNLANLYQRVGNNRAAQIAELALKLAPDHPGIQDTLGWILVEQGQLPRGLDLLRKAVTRSPNAATVRYRYGVALARSGQKAAARKELEAAIAGGQEFPELEEAKRLLKSL